MNTIFIPFGVLALVIGMLAALSELLPRYRDEPFKTSFSTWGLSYQAFNGLLAVIAYAVLAAAMEPDGDVSGWRLLQHAVVGGFGSVVVLRARILPVSVGGEEK